MFLNFLKRTHLNLKSLGEILVDDMEIETFKSKRPPTAFRTQAHNV